MRRFLILMLGFTVLLSTAVFAQMNMGHNIMGAPLIPEGTRIGMLPGTDVAFFTHKDKPEKLYMLSGNGRFVFSEVLLYDTWTEKYISKPADLEGLNVVEPEKVDILINEVKPVSFGKGKGKIVVFYDPIDDRYFDVVNKALEYQKKNSAVRLYLLPYPSVLSGSRDVVSEFYCHKEKNRLKIADMFNTYSKVKQSYDYTGANCTLLDLHKTMLFGRFIGVNSLPFIIWHNNQIIEGANEFDKMLNGDKK